MSKVVLSSISVGVSVFLALVFSPVYGRAPLRPGPIPKIVTVDLGRGVKLELIRVDPGEFEMGSPKVERVRNPFPDQKAADAEMEHRIVISHSFYLGMFSVTQEQYTQLTCKKNPSSFSISGDGASKVARLDTTHFPVERVSWSDAKSYCDELNRVHLSAIAERLRRSDYSFRLPTEAEWEYACRAGSITSFHFGNDLDGTQANCNANFLNGSDKERPYLERSSRVGSYDANPWGFFDMHGNVWQWCGDWYGADYYHKSPQKDPNGPKSGSCRVLRGGCWNVPPWLCRSACRCYERADKRSDLIGFRVALCPDSSREQ